MNKDLFIFKNIWFADDDPDDAVFFEDALKEIKWNASLNVITSGEVLVRSFQNLQPPDLLFLDIHMPVMDGRKCLRFIRNTLQLKDLPIIVYSSSASPRDMLASYKLGANLFVKKPDSYGDIVRTIKQIMKMDWSKPCQIASQFFVDNKYVPFRAE